MIPEKKWEWFGHAAHFICGKWCRFHMATLVGKVLVSTVGELVHPSNSGDSEKQENEYLMKNPFGADIGYKRKYETMAFRAGPRCKAEGCGCGLPSINGSELASAGYNAAGDAARGHMAMCRKFAKRRKKCR